MEVELRRWACSFASKSLSVLATRYAWARRMAGGSQGAEHHRRGHEGTDDIHFSFPSLCADASPAPPFERVRDHDSCCRRATESQEARWRTPIPFPVRCGSSCFRSAPRLPVAQSKSRDRASQPERSFRSQSKYVNRGVEKASRSWELRPSRLASADLVAEVGSHGSRFLVSPAGSEPTAAHTVPSLRRR